MLDAHVKWVDETKPAEVRCSACDSDKDAHMQVCLGWDLLHRPVVYASFKWAKQEQRLNAAQAVEHNIECFNHIISLMPTGVEQWVTVVDFVTYSHWSDGRSPVGRAVIDVMEAHYPERLGLQILVDPPTTFFVLWKMLSPFIAEETKSKVRMFYTESEPNIKDEFPKIFPPHMSDYLINAYERNKRVHKEGKKAKKEESK